MVGVWKELSWMLTKSSLRALKGEKMAMERLFCHADATDVSTDVVRAIPTGYRSSPETQQLLGIHRCWCDG